MHIADKFADVSPSARDPRTISILFLNKDIQSKETSLRTCCFVCLKLLFVRPKSPIFMERIVEFINLPACQEGIRLRENFFFANFAFGHFKLFDVFGFWAIIGQRWDVKNLGIMPSFTWLSVFCSLWSANLLGNSMIGWTSFKIMSSPVPCSSMPNIPNSLWAHAVLTCQMSCCMSPTEKVRLRHKYFSGIFV